LELSGAHFSKDWNSRGESPAVLGKRMDKRLILFGLGCCMFASCTTIRTPGRRTQRVTVASLLGEMTNRDALAQISSPAFMLKQASSYDRATTDPKNEKTWFANKDYEQFIRIETNDTRREWVIMEHEGPGAVVRFWLPLHAPRDNQIIRFYFDGSTKPGIEVKFNDLLSGRAFIPPPFAFVAWNELDLRNQQTAAPKTLRGVGGDLYFPIPYAKSCKITLDQLPFYFIADYRAYAPGTEVETFTMEKFAATKSTMNRIGDALLADRPSSPATKSFKATIAPGATLAVAMPKGANAIRNITVKIDPADAPQVLRSVVITADFDGEQTIWSPLGEFFGTGARLNPVHDWFRSAATDGVLTVRWVMPYQREATVGLKNFGEKPVQLELSAAASSAVWDDRSMYFHANWRCSPKLATRPMSDWNYITIDGTARYVGDTLTVFSPDKAWYGEGDEKIYVDGETFPSFIGTGTEDYYGYAWGMATWFSSPFISAPHRDLDSRSDWRGFTTTSRLRLLDSIPFQKSLRFDMEIWDWADTKTDYAVGTFWYARPGAKHNRVPQPREAALPIPELPQPKKIPGAVEFETMKILSQSDSLKIEHQEKFGFESGERWSNDTQLFVQAKKAGEFVELLVGENVKGPARLTLHATKSYDYGTLRFIANGKQIGGDFDGYAAKPEICAPVELGIVEPKDGKIILRVEVTGTNPSSRGPRYYFGLDALQVTAP
jgi:hypothetical protein